MSAVVYYMVDLSNSRTQGFYDPTTLGTLDFSQSPLLQGLGIFHSPHCFRGLGFFTDPTAPRTEDLSRVRKVTGKITGTENLTLQSIVPGFVASGIKCHWVHKVTRSGNVGLPGN